MAAPAATRSFLEHEVDALEPDGFVAIGLPGDPLRVVEVSRGPEDDLTVRIPGRPRPLPELPVSARSSLVELGFTSSDPADQTKPWSRESTGAADAVDHALAVVHEVFGGAADDPIDIAHGSHRAEREARAKLERLRGRVEKVLTDMQGRAPTQDSDGDFEYLVDDVKVILAPRAALDGHVILRVFAVTNIGVNMTPELGLFLARLNFGLMFGRFSLDTDHQAIFIDETLLGDQVSDEEIRFMTRVVARTADEWDDRLKPMFGGVTFHEVERAATREERPGIKPGEGGYL